MTLNAWRNVNDDGNHGIMIFNFTLNNIRYFFSEIMSHANETWQDITGIPSTIKTSTDRDPRSHRATSSGESVSNHIGGCFSIHLPVSRAIFLLPSYR